MDLNFDNMLSKYNMYTIRDWFFEGFVLMLFIVIR